MNQGYTLGTILKTFDPCFHFLQCWHSSPPTHTIQLHNFCVDRETYSSMVQISKLFVAFFLSAVTIPLVVALPGSAKPPLKRPLPSTSVFLWHGYFFFLIICLSFIKTIRANSMDNKPGLVTTSSGTVSPSPGGHTTPSSPPKTTPPQPKTTLPQPKTTLPPPTSVDEHCTPTEPKKSGPIPPLSGTVPQSPSPGGHTTPSPPPTPVDEHRTSSHKAGDVHRKPSSDSDWEEVPHDVSKY